MRVFRVTIKRYHVVQMFDKGTTFYWSPHHLSLPIKISEGGATSHSRYAIKKPLQINVRVVYLNSGVCVMEIQSPFY